MYCNSAEQQLIRIIKSRKTPLSANELAAMLSTSNRQLRAMISHLRADHHVPICSTSREGYYLPWSRSAADSTIAQLKARQRELQAAIDGIKDGLDEWLGYPCQMDLDMEVSA